MDIFFGDEFSLSDYKMRVRDGYQRPLFAPFSNKTKSVPGRPGAWDFGIDIEPRADSYPIVCLAKGNNERENLIREFTGRLFDQNAQPKKFKVRTSLDPELWIECRVSTQSTGTPYREGPVVFSLQLTAFDDPFKRATQTAFDPKEPVYYDQVVPGDFYRNPSSFDWIYSRHYYGCYNYGSLKTNIVFTITNGTAKNPSITHIESGRELTLPDFTNKTVVIDTGKKIITVNGVEILSGSNMKFFSLLPGANGFLFQGEGVKGKVASLWLHKFM